MNGDPEPSKRIVAHLLHEISEGRKYFRSKHISKALGMSTKTIGTRLWMMERYGTKGIRVTKYSDKIWRVEICHGCRDVRGNPRAV
jgi:hypothetical protein